MADETRGMYCKYEVKRLNDADGKHDSCNYFVLDLKHDKFAAKALRAYARACRAEFPELAKDIDNILQFPIVADGEYFSISMSTAASERIRLAAHIRSRMTQSHVAALEKAKRAAALRALEDYQKACILEDEGNCIDSMFGENELKRRIAALSAPAGAAQEASDGEARRG